MTVSRWNNAALQQYFLAYNFRPKTEWPDVQEVDRVVDSTRWVGIRRAAGLPLEQRFYVEASAELPADMPPGAIFKRETPRYPNIWFYGPMSDFPNYDAFVQFLTDRFRSSRFESEEV